MWDHTHWYSHCVKFQTGSSHHDGNFFEDVFPPDIVVSQQRQAGLLDRHVLCLVCRVGKHAEREMLDMRKKQVPAYSQLKKI